MGTCWGSGRLSSSSEHLTWRRLANSSSRLFFLVLFFCYSFWWFRRYFSCLGYYELSDGWGINFIGICWRNCFARAATDEEEDLSQLRSISALIKIIRLSFSFVSFYYSIGNSLEAKPNCTAFEPKCFSFYGFLKLLSFPRICILTK